MSAAVRAGPGATARQGLHYLAVSVLLFGGIWPMTKAALAHATPLWFALNRGALAALVTTALLALLRRLRGRRGATCPASWRSGCSSSAASSR